MKKIYTIILCLFLSIIINAQSKNTSTTNQKTGQSDDDIAALKKTVNNLLLQVKTLHRR